MSIKEAKLRISEYLFARNDLKIGYEDAQDKWLFVEYNVLDMLDLPAHNILVEYAEDLLEEPLLEQTSD